MTIRYVTSVPFANMEMLWNFGHAFYELVVSAENRLFENCAFGSLFRVYENMYVCIYIYITYVDIYWYL